MSTTLLLVLGVFGGVKEALPAGARAPQLQPGKAAVGETIHVIRYKKFMIPVEASTSARNQVKLIRLFVSRDQGKTWAIAGQILPDQDHFPYSAPEDGLYWFGVQTVDTNGTKHPQNTAMLKVDLVVRVDSQSQKDAEEDPRQALREAINQLRAQLQRLEQRLAELESQKKPK
ncbi:MAG: hypothetical protein L0Z62_39820 [Gemmataceae bacterium]|nr:hypothetical protein [Gemmataceae bacterium]